MIRSFLYGITLPWRSAQLIARKPALLAWSLLPICITVVLYIYLIQGLQGWTDINLHHLLSRWGWDHHGWAAWTLLLFSRVFVFIVGALTFSITASLIASPFNDFLAETAERFSTPPLPPVQSVAWRQKLRLVWLDVGKTLAAAVASLVAIVVCWIPVVNLIAMVCAFLLMTFQYISYPQTRRGLGIGDGLSFLWRHFFSCAGFGAALAFLFAIPLLSVLVMPLAVVGGTLLVARAPGIKENELKALK